MMIRTAGGPGLVSPFDYNERRTPRFTRTTWIAVAIVAAGHIGVGAALYYKRFELVLPVEVEPPVTTIEMVPLPKPKPPEPVVAPATPTPPTTRTNPLPATPTTTDVVSVEQGETVAVGPSISLLQPSPTPVTGAPTVTTP
ncbi:MAG: hypothetical protein U1E24_16860, partial [Phenylobacterium sp.]|nr:hypothetical protein [Phenylobacterium sp.]